MFLKKDIHRKMIYKYDEEVFSIIFYMKNKISKDQLCDFFILMNENYPLFKYKSSNISDNNIDENNLIDSIINYIVKNDASYYDLFFDIPVFIQKNNKVESIFIDKGIGITIEKDERFGFVFIIDIFPNVFIDTNSYLFFEKDENKWLDIEIDQKIAAPKNRKIISSFLNNVELIFKTKISKIDSMKYDMKSILNL